MDDAVGLQVEETICELAGKKRINLKDKSMDSTRKKKSGPALLDKHGLVDNLIEEDDALGCRVLLFDDSVENHLRAMDNIFDICGEAGANPYQEDEIERLSNSVTFLREWRHFNYKARKIRFASETRSPQGKDALEGISLPQFSAAQAPEVEFPSNEAKFMESRNNFVLYAGGAVWALDWCPRQDRGPDFVKTCEFIAISAHPPDSAYHKLGAPLSGRGMVQIWCLLNSKVRKEDVPVLTSKPRRKSLIDIVKKTDDSQPKRPRGRPRKYPVDTTSNNPDCEDHAVETPAIEFLQSPSNIPCVVNDQNFVVPTKANDKSAKDKVAKECKVQVKKPRGRPRKNPASDNRDGEKQSIGTLSTEFPQSASNVPSVENEEDVPVPITKANYKSQDNNLEKKGESQSMRPRGQPMKNPVNIRSIKKNCKKQALEAFASDFSESATYVPCGDGNLVKSTAGDENLSDENRNSKSKKKWKNDASISEKKGLDNSPLSTQNMDVELSTSCPKEDNLGQCDGLSVSTLEHDGSGVALTGYPAPKVPLLPRVVLCIGHEGKVALDLKWRPCSTSYSECKGRIGYLAVVLGNGSLEVWEIPSPKIMKPIYFSRREEGTDPRFVKLKPVFRCAMLKCGDRQSIPLTVEWSTSSPHNLIMVGCHDGMVALWKFSTSNSSKDARPLLFFSADTVPIRTLAWAPCESDPESANVIVTAGHEGMKFWDLRDPFHPLWDIAAQRFMYSLDWLPEPRCVVTSYDDGTLRVLSLSKAANDAPVTGKPYSGTQQQGLHSYYCSSFAIWSVHFSRHTGLVAYCSADGTTLYFQLTSKAVDKDPFRNRAPHFLCGSLTEEGGDIIVNIPLGNAPYPMKKSLNEWGNTPRSLRGFVHDSNQARRAKDQLAYKQKNDDQPLELFNEDDLGSEDGAQPLLALGSPKACTSSSKKSNKNNSVDEDGEMGHDKKGIEDGKALGEIAVFPSKMVAMHRVRWNMNKGSERWLCYGGAAGIVRCQEISPPEFDKKLVKNVKF